MIEDKPGIGRRRASLLSKGRQFWTASRKLSRRWGAQPSQDDAWLGMRDRYRSTEPHLPSAVPAPEAWQDLTRHFDELDLLLAYMPRLLEEANKALRRGDRASLVRAANALSRSFSAASRTAEAVLALTERRKAWKRVG